MSKKLSLTIEKIPYLKQLFQNCPPNIIEKIQYIKLKKGDILLSEGEPCNWVYMIVKGKAVGLMFQSDSDVYSFIEYSEADILGDFELFGNIPAYRITIKAMTECEYLAISAKNYMDWVTVDVNALLLRMRKLMSTLTNETYSERKYLNLGCKDRLITFLINRYEREHRNGNFILKMTQPEIAENICFNIRTIQRNIKALQDEDMIDLKKGKISISKMQYKRLKENIEKI